MIDRTLGRYRITAKLGEGGMGSVWRAEDPALGRTVALKLLSPALWASDSARQRFLREARAASKLDHPAIATVYDVGETDGHAWIAYQFIDGETIAARCERGPLPLGEAVSVAREIRRSSVASSASRAGIVLTYRGADRLTSISAQARRTDAPTLKVKSTCSRRACALTTFLR